jgi:protein-tyrosine phosphatase
MVSRAKEQSANHGVYLAALLEVGVAGLIDVHNHLLPDIDDGSRTVAQSVLVLNQFADQGVTDVVLTPHVSAGELAIDKDDPLERRDVALTLLGREAPDVPRLHLGFEIMLDVPLSLEILDDRRFSLAASRYFLVEFYISVSEDDATSLLRGLSGYGAIPVVAHAERYRNCSVRVVSKWKQLGAKISVDATTLARSNHRGKVARQLLGAGLVDLVAADNHGDDRVISNAVRFLSEHGSAHIGELLAGRNPQAILDDADMALVPAVPFRDTMWSKISRFIGR